MTMNFRRWAFLPIAIIAAAIDGENGVAQLPATSSTTPLPALSLPPNVSDWSPRGRVYPGQVLIIRGQGFDPSKFNVRVGSGTTAITLAVSSGTATEIRATVPGQLTGSAGAPLTVRHTGGQTRELEASFRILPRDAKFVGPSLWHTADATTSPIFAQGTVTLNLELLEFAQSGQGSYGETVRLVRLFREYQEDCTNNLFLPGKTDVREWTVQTVSAGSPTRTGEPSRIVSWQRLPDGRIEIRNGGIDPVTLVAVVNAQVATANFSTTAAGGFTEATVTRTSCSGGAISTEVPPLRGVPFRRVQWSLARQ